MPQLRENCVETIFADPSFVEDLKPGEKRPALTSGGESMKRRLVVESEQYFK